MGNVQQTRERLQVFGVQSDDTAEPIVTATAKRSDAILIQTTLFHPSPSADNSAMPAPMAHYLQS